MNITILGSVTSPIPPNGQAAIESLAYYQAMGLAERGHKILLFAPSGSQVSHKNITLVEVANKVMLTGIGKEGKAKEEELFGASYKLRLEIVNLANVIDQLFEQEKKYDVILNNLRGEAVIFSAASILQKPIYHLMHLPLFPELADCIKKHRVSLLSISNAQRKAFPDLNYKATIYNAVNTDKFSFSPKQDNYLLYLGSIGKNKNPKDAILAARQAGEVLLIGGRIKDETYFKEEIAPYIDGKQIQWIGEKHPEEVITLYQRAKAFLFPIKWEEPFGLVMIEAMSCGTPVIAYNNGAVPEVVVDGLTGYVVDNDSQMVDAIKKIDAIDRLACRKHAEEHFTIDRMIDSLEKALETI
ncbi:MAG: glycosyltransferase family 4 protein [Candidatus Levybacteria bacterium]|nr:glycosyltransferase family 4 protein [Candidatus Levybacteria bacterium]